MRRTLILLMACAAAGFCAPPAAADSLRDRVDDLEQEVASMTEDIEDLREPVQEFDLFDQCAFTIGVTQFGGWNDSGYLFGAGGRLRRPALAIDMRGFGTPQYNFLAFPGEEPPSIECNEDAEQEFIDG